MARPPSRCSLYIIFLSGSSVMITIVRLTNVYIYYIFEFPTLHDETAPCKCNLIEGKWIYKSSTHNMIYKLTFYKPFVTLIAFIYHLCCFLLHKGCVVVAHSSACSPSFSLIPLITSTTITTTSQYLFVLSRPTLKQPVNLDTER